MKKNSFIAFIPARKNSTRLKNKNLFPIGKKKLIDFTIISAIRANIFEDIYLSTDSTEMISYVNKKYKSIKKYFAKEFKPYVIGKISRGKNKIKLNGFINWL